MRRGKKGSMYYSNTLFQPSLNAVNKTATKPSINQRFDFNEITSTVQSASCNEWQERTAAKLERLSWISSQKCHTKREVTLWVVEITVLKEINSCPDRCRWPLARTGSGLENLKLPPTLSRKKLITAASTLVESNDLWIASSTFTLYDPFIYRKMQSKITSVIEEKYGWHNSLILLQ